MNVAEIKYEFVKLVAITFCEIFSNEFCGKIFSKLT